ncbi:hypothetical protein ACFRCG_39810 [Embleya sp. NPDC056575]|uniref:hypothetical protein n=1 Tax=unclassified Embleya TaxID=2699296 RepID=UPI0036AA4911
MHEYPNVHDLAGQMLAQTTAGTAPQQQPPASPQGLDVNSGVTGTGSLIIAVFILGMGVKGWKTAHKQAKTWTIMTIIVMCLTATTAGLFGVLRVTINQTGNSVGNSVTQTTTGR